MNVHTPGPWHWLGSHSLVANHGKRPAVLSARELKQRDAVTGLLVDFDADSPDARLIASAPEMHALIEHIGDLVHNVFEQMVCGNWVDDHGHPVRLNRTMAALIKPVKDAIDAIEIQAKARGGR